MDLRLEKRVFFVTGGSKGIGRAIVKNLLMEGAYVSTCARNKTGLIKLHEGLPNELKPNLLTNVCDVLNAGGMEKALFETISEYGQLDGIVANAGSGSSGNVLETSAEDWVNQYETKMFSVLNAVKPIIPELKKASDPRIVIINGVTANVPTPDMAAVSAARAAVKQMACLLAQALAPDICVNTVNIGVIDTERQLARFEKANSIMPYEEWKKHEAKRRGILIGRFGKAEEVAPMVSLLLSPLSSYITGASVDIAGGLICPS